MRGAGLAQAVGGAIEFGASPLLAVTDIALGRAARTLSGNTLPDTFMSDAAFTIAGALSMRPSGGVARSGVVDSADVFGKPQLLSTEGNVGTYRDLIRAGTPGDNITPNHIPSANRMAREGVSPADGIAINMEQPWPGVGGRHRATFTYGTQADNTMSPRDALAAGVWDTRQIYMKDGLYTPEMRGNLQELIQMNKLNHPEIFRKPIR